MFKTDMYLMFDEVWNGEYNEYAVESRIIGVETLYSMEYTRCKVLVCPFYKEKGEGTIFEYCTIHSNIVKHRSHVWPEERV